MKHNNHLISTFILVFINITIAIAQQTITASGGNATGSGGSASYTVGQVIYTTATGSGGSVLHGVQIPYEISVVTALDLSKNIDLSYSVYPNPTTNYLTLKIEGESTYKYSATLIDLKGKVLETFKIKGNESLISMQNLPPAIYFLKITDKNKDVKTFKIIKK